MYKFYNSNALGKYEDDCVIRAISCATGKSWDEVYDNLSDLAQAQGTMFDKRNFVINYLDSKYERLDVGNKSVGEVSGMFPNNVVLITMRGHITCSKPYRGKPTVYDTFDCRNRQAEYCFIVK